VTPKDHQHRVSQLTRLLAAHRDAEDLIQIGAYVKGKNADVDRALELMPIIRDYLCQDRTQDANLESSIEALADLLVS
jgi:flagellum-specific ATP synthase